MTAFLAGVTLIVLGALAAALLRGAAGERAYHALLVAGCGTAGVAAARAVAGGTATLAVPSTLPGGAWIIGLDPLTGLFLLAILFVGALCAVYGTRYLASGSHGRASPVAQAGFAILVAAIALVVAARSVVVFLMAWEVMAISSYLLIVADHQQADVRRAGVIYLVATHTATLALFALFALWSGPGGDWSFDALSAAAPRLSPGTRTAILLLAVTGFGFKAGLVPLHFWLPPAHAAAPSHVSALMSGIVIKTGIYGLLRVLLLLGGAPAWFGWLALGIGVTSGVLGVLWALAQHDLKRLLAYHSVENIGIILMGLGVGVLGDASGNRAIATVGFAGALLHTVNHALFKSLLFLGAGSVYRATGTRIMDELGGLARRLPLTWAAFIIGATAIVGLPPLNGFVSEWLVFQGLWSAGQSGTALRFAVLGVPALALIGALALACFAKVAGVVFLGQPRSARAEGVNEPGRGMTVPALTIAAACVVLGVLPPLGLFLTRAATVQLAGVSLPATVTAGAWVLALIAGALVALGAILWSWRARLFSRRPPRWEPTWGCGFPEPSPRMQYTASSFAAPLLGMFGRMSGIRAERHGLEVHTHPLDLVLDAAAVPFWDRLQRVARRLRPMQQGRLVHYLLYVMASLLVLLTYLALEFRR
jgi:hydrogenase-4 component B